jgi:RsiW-degrading membrane proteinase PrsW (M82 family)
MLTFALILIFIAIAVGMVYFMLKNDKGEKEPVTSLWIAAGFGFAAAILAGFIENILIPQNNLKAGASLGTMLISFLAVGVIEESLKFIPLAIFIWPKRYFNEHTDGIIYFAIAGLGFGLPENILYTMQYGDKTGLGRLILTPFFHAAITAMVGYFLVKAKLSKKSPLSVWPIFLAAIALHSLYDFGLASGTNIFVVISITITLALSLNFFNIFYRAEDRDEDLGLAVVGHNSYCRSCGAANRTNKLYCIHCGKRA